jgi:hypothetical protein
VQPEGELGDDAEVAAAAAQCPEQVGVLTLAGGDDAAVGQHDLSGDQVVAGQAVRPIQVPDAAAEGESADTGGGDDASGGGQPVRNGGVVHHGPGGAAAHPRGVVRGVDLDAGQAGQVDDDRVVGGAEPGHAVPAAADRDGTAGGDGVRHGGLHVLGAGAADDGLRPGVDHEVVYVAGVFVLGVLWSDDRSGDELPQCGGGHERFPLCQAFRDLGSR